MTDPSDILEKTSLWTAALREHEQVDAETADRLAQTLKESVGERLDQPDDPLLVVMLCGPTAVGKSSLINALAGADISSPGLGATTAAAVLYVHEADDPARLYAYSHLLGSRAQPETTLVRHRRDALLHKVLVDTPDIDSVRLQHKDLTTSLVHAADLVLFVTSPEKYKNIRSVRWILEQRQQRAMAFVLNKWDQAALGLQHGRRSEIEADFRTVLAREGYADALIFKVSALPDGRSTGIENDLPALWDWLETGLSQSTASLIRQRRQRAAWGRLAAVIEPMVPKPLSGQPLLAVVTNRLTASGTFAEQSVNAEAALLAPAELEDLGWPVTPGLLGMMTRTRQRIASASASLRSGFFARSSTAPASDLGLQSLPGRGFGARSVAALSETAGQVMHEASAARMALGPVGRSWTDEFLRLERHLALLPLDVTTEQAAEAIRPTFRRRFGIVSLYFIELLIIVVLLLAVGRIGIDFVGGTYASGSLFITVLQLILILLIIGQTLASLFFPPLRTRIRRIAAQRARSLVRLAMETAQAALRKHVEAVDQLARQGEELLRLIDRTVVTLVAQTADDRGINRLFGQVRSPATEELLVEPAQDAGRRPTFD